MGSLEQFGFLRMLPKDIFKFCTKQPAYPMHHIIFSKYNSGNLSSTRSEKISTGALKFNLKPNAKL